ncbi:hypothetical protein C8J57DRAFT_224190 [Mycena rebaudengoi]|nr:hypothetical protein C8J57DRAFT_224190 [Mycena rebaudengoi]
MRCAHRARGSLRREYLIILPCTDLPSTACSLALRSSSSPSQASARSPPAPSAYSSAWGVIPRHLSTHVPYNVPWHYLPARKHDLLRVRADRSDEHPCHPIRLLAASTPSRTCTPPSSRRRRRVRASSPVRSPRSSAFAHRRHPARTDDIRVPLLVGAPLTHVPRCAGRARRVHRLRGAPRAHARTRAWWGADRFAGARAAVRWWNWPRAMAESGCVGAAQATRGKRRTAVSGGAPPDAVVHGCALVDGPMVLDRRAVRAAPVIYRAAPTIPLLVYLP